MLKVGVVQRFVEYSRKDLTINLASYCPYCKHKNTRILKLTLEPEVVKCEKCGKLYIDSFQVKKDAEELKKELGKLRKKVEAEK